MSGGKNENFDIKITYITFFDAFTKTFILIP